MDITVLEQSHGCHGSPFVSSLIIQYASRTNKNIQKLINIHMSLHYHKLSDDIMVGT